VALTGAAVVLRDDVVMADVVFESGMLTAIGTAPRAAVTIDCTGCHLLPGFVDLHTDNIERHLEPRPGQFGDPVRALVAHDAELAAAGITTAFDAITLGGAGADSPRQAAVLGVVDALDRARRADGLLRIDHRLHVRCELSDAALPVLMAAIRSARPPLLSLMNHTPGQGQWRNAEAFQLYYSRRHGLSEREIDVLVLERQASAATVVPSNRAQVLSFAREAAARLASHDDTEPRDIDEAVAAGCSLSEFPTTAEAAACASGRGLAIIAGAPNLVRGNSHSGNVSVAELARAGHFSILASDYRPASLIEAVFALPERCGWPLARAVHTVSLAPAHAMGFADRGDLAVGRRADVIVVKETGYGPVVRETWAAGRRVF